MKQTNWLVLGLIVCGISLILISVILPRQQFQFGFSKNPLAQVVEKTGAAVFYPADSMAEYTVASDTALSAKDSIRTHENSEILLQFSNGGQLRLAPQTEVMVDQLRESQPVVIVKSGHVFVEKFGDSSSYWIRKEGQLLSASDFALMNKSGSPLPAPNPTASSENLDEQISQIEIESILTAKKTDFFKCFGQLIQRNPQAAGQVLLSFTIERTGKTNKIEISKSDIQDDSFKACLVEVVARTQFRSFSGYPIATVFPLKFE